MPDVMYLRTCCVALPEAKFMKVETLLTVSRTIQHDIVIPKAKRILQAKEVAVIRLGVVS